MILVCGRYEGIDARIDNRFIDDEISIGDFVLTGGELAAMVVMDAVTRLIPGALGGADSAKMDSFADGLLEHPHFTHLRARAADLKRREFSQVQWLMTDANIAPTSTLDAVEAIVTHRHVHVSGMLLTLKLLDWSMAGEIETYLARIRSWGYRHIRARQLALNRREICVLAAKSKSRLRLRGR